MDSSNRLNSPLFAASWRISLAEAVAQGLTLMRLRPPEHCADLRPMPFCIMTFIMSTVLTCRFLPNSACDRYIVWEGGLSRLQLDPVEQYVENVSSFTHSADRRDRQTTTSGTRVPAHHMILSMLSDHSVLLHAIPALCMRSIPTYLVYIHTA